MNHNRQINRLIGKGLFDERLKQKKRTKKILKAACLIVSVLIIITLLTLFYQIIPSSSIEISSENQTTENQLTKRTSQNRKLNIFKSILPSSLTRIKENQSTVNILALGRPGQGYSGQDLTDTIILIHLKPVKKEAVLISLPRDLLVRTPNHNRLTKINSLYSLAGIEGLKEKIKEITGLPIDHYILIDLVVAKEIINLVDGLNIYVPQDIDDPYFPGPNHTYQTFNLAAGWRYLDGQTALKYIRTRYTSPNGDFDRMARQQQVIQLLKQKVLSLNLLWDFPTYLKIFNTLKNHIETDLGLLEIKSLWQIVKQTNADQISSLVIDKKETGLLIGSQVMFGEQRASVVYPKTGQGNYNEIKEYIQKVITSN